MMWKWLIKDKRIKIVSILIAIVLWFYVNSAKTREATFSVTPEIYDVPQGYVVKRIIPAKAKIKLRGKFVTLFVQGFRRPKLRIAWNPLNSFPGMSKCSFGIPAKDLEIYHGLEVIKIEPIEGSYEFEKMQNK